MLSGSLKERLAQLKSLKEEEKREEEKKAAAVPEVTPAPAEEEPAEAVSEAEKHVEVEEYEEVVENETEAAAEDDASFVEDVEEPSEVDQSRGESEQDQDVFKALDEAERADSPSEDGVLTNTEPKAMPESADGAPKEGRSKKKCVLVAIFFACVAIVAIVLPFYFEYPDGPFKKSGSGSESSSDDSEPSAPGTSPTNPPTISPTGAPSDAPTTLQWGQFLQAFLVPISGEEVFQDETSPQYLAAKFILDDDYTAEVPTTGQLNDRYASAVFYFATEGENWKSCYYGDVNCESGQWLVGDVCDWYAVSCDDDGRVVSYLFADAEGNGLVGTLPPEMRLMSFMTDLVIVNDSIKGALPEAFGESATALRSLLLPDNELSGEIPDNYLSNSPLEYVHLANNKFSGPIPTKLGQTTDLLQLDLSGNSFTGALPAGLEGYEAIEALSLANNGLQGSIPEEVYSLVNLKFLHTNGNELTGSISKAIGSLSSLKELRVGHSELTGHIPDELLTLTGLVEVDISMASFDGRLSLGFVNLESLEKLNVSNNNLSGTVPFGFGELNELSVLNLEGNDFVGVIPSSVCLLRDDSLEALTADCEKVACDCCTSCM